MGSFAIARGVIAAAVAGALAAAASAQDADAGKAKSAPCAACHGADGNPAAPIFPILAGQTARYIYLELRDFQAGRRQNPAMVPFVKDLTKSDMLDLAAYFAAQKPRPPDFKPDPAKVKLGEAKATETLCTMCHLGGLKGQNEVPRVAGQNHDYVVKQLGDFKSGARTNDAGTMSSVAKTLKDEDIENLAHYIDTLD